MLERAVRRVHNAKQLLRLCPDRRFGRSRALHPDFWTYNPEHEGDARGQYPFAARKPTVSRRDKAIVFDSPLLSTPLEFLYPPSTRSFVSSYFVSPRKKIGGQGRKRNPCRAYSSGANNDTLASSSNHGRTQLFAGSEDVTGPEEKLQKILSGDDPQLYESAWVLYHDAGAPLSLRPQLLRYLSTSKSYLNTARCQFLLENIPTFQKTAQDYFSAVKSLLHKEGLEGAATEVCQEAMSILDAGECWHYVFMVLVDRMDWNNVMSLWKCRPEILAVQPPFSDLPLNKTISSRLFALTDRLLERGHSYDSITTGGYVAKHLFRMIISVDTMMVDIKMESLLRHFSDLISLGLVNDRDYSIAITTLIQSKMRSANGRAMLVYRNFRWRMPHASPSRKLIGYLLRMLSRLEAFEGVDYLMRECRALYGMPSPKNYRHAFTTYARLGEVGELHSLLAEYLQDHGNPTDPRLVTPLLYVHARTGNVKDVHYWFDYVQTNFGAKPDVTYWNILLTAYAKNQDVDGAVRTFKEMTNSGISPDSVSFAILMGFSAKRGDTNAVMAIYDLVRENNIPLNGPMFDTIVQTLCQNRRYSDAERVVEEAVSMFQPSELTRCWNILLWNYALNVDIHAISKAQDRMQQAGIPFDGMTYAALMLSLVRVGKTDSARQVLGVLHRSRTIHLTIFHYALLLHGYVHEHNRDMAYVLYSEMVSRFYDPGPSGKLAMLRGQIDRDLRRLRETGGLRKGGKVEMPHVEKFLESIMKEFDVRALTSRHSGAQGHDAFPERYYEHVIRAYASEKETKRAGDLYLELSEKTKKLLSNTKPPSPRMLHALMVNYLNDDKHYEVEKCFQAAFTHILQVARPVKIQAAFSLDNGSDDGTGSVDQRSYYDDIPTILPSYRFDLSHCLSTYIISLFHQNLHSKIAGVVEQIENYGFELTIHNWSLYINILCRTQEPGAQFQAFKIFEEKFMPNYPGWKAIKLGYALKSKTAPDSIDLVEGTLRRGKRPDLFGKKARKLWSNVEPDYLVPSYLNVLHLASALIDFRSRSILDGGREMQQLYSTAPQTYEAVATIPFLEEKFQGILRQVRTQEDRVRSRTEIPNPEETPWTGGILGPGEERIDTRPLEMIPVEHDDFRAEMEQEETFESNETSQYLQPPEELEEISWHLRPPEQLMQDEQEQYLGNLSSEPDLALLEALIEEDNSRPTTKSDAPPAESTLTPEDEWAQDHETFLQQESSRTSKK
ncbi:hypothetical protein FQN57_007435 [Myotisia sp. PD_48]|nr:hypothetical protein FQN57_007435 [Myotisia sp. PD_48]